MSIPQKDKFVNKDNETINLLISLIFINVCSVNTEQKQLFCKMIQCNCYHVKDGVLFIHMTNPQIAFCKSLLVIDTK